MTSNFTRLPTSTQFMSVLARVEARYPVIDWRVGGVDMWPMTRLQWLWAQWDRAHRPGASTIAEQSRLRKLTNRLGQLARGRRQRNAARRNDSRAEVRDDGSRDVVFLSDGISFVARQGRWYDRFCDPLIEALAADGLSSLLVTTSHTYLQPRWTPSIFIQPELDVAHLTGAMRARTLAASSELPRYEDVRKEFAAEGLDHFTLDRRMLLSNASRIQATAQAYGSILDRRMPRLAFIVSYYSIDGMGFIVACRQRGIPVVDLQHGVQGALHPAYGSFPRRDRKLGVLPDWFWVWSAREQQAILDWAGREGAHRAVIGGNPWLNSWLHMRGEFAAEADEQVRELLVKAGGRRVAFITLQPGISSLADLAPLGALMAMAGDSWQWWVRMHPSMTTQRDEICSFLRSTGCRFDLDKASSLPLYGLLRHVDVHLTQSSSTVIEAEMFGVCSVITSEFGAELFPAQLDRGTAKFVAGPVAAVLEALHQMAARRTSPASGADETRQALDVLLRVSGLKSAEAA